MTRAPSLSSPSRNSSRWAILIVVGALLLPAKTGWCEEENPEVLIRQGVQLRKKGQDAKAHGYFERAYALGHTPRAAAQLGLSEVALKQWRDADVLLREALASGDPWVETNRAALEKGLSLARAHLGAVKISGAPPGASAQLGSGDPSRLPDDGVIWSTPGASTLKLSADGFRPFERDVTLEIGKTVEVPVDMVALPKPPIARTEPPPHGQTGAASPGDGSSRSTGGKTSASVVRPPPPKPPVAPDPASDTGHGARVASFVVGGVGVAALAAGLVFRQVATSKIDAANADGKAGRPYDAANDSYRTFDRLGVGCLIGGGIAVAAGLLGVILTGGSEESGGKPSVALTWSGGSRALGAGIAGTF